MIGAPFFEEVFFRGVLLRSLARLFGRWGGWAGPALAVVVSGTLFGLAHAESLQLSAPAFFGVVLGVVVLPDRPPGHEHGGPRVVQRWWPWSAGGTGAGGRPGTGLT